MAARHEPSLQHIFPVSQVVSVSEQPSSSWAVDAHVLNPPVPAASSLHFPHAPIAGPALPALAEVPQYGAVEVTAVLHVTPRAVLH